MSKAAAPSPAACGLGSHNESRLVEPCGRKKSCDCGCHQFAERPPHDYRPAPRGALAYPDDICLITWQGLDIQRDASFSAYWLPGWSHPRELYLATLALCLAAPSADIGCPPRSLSLAGELWGCAHSLPLFEPASVCPALAGGRVPSPVPVSPTTTLVLFTISLSFLWAFPRPAPVCPALA